MGGQFIISGSETAELYPGYMDGAVESAHSVVEKIESKINYRVK